MLFDIDQGGKLGAHFFIQFSDLFDQCLGLLTVVLLNGLVELFSQVDDLAIGLDLSLLSLPISPTRFRASDFNLATFCC